MITLFACALLVSVWVVRRRSASSGVDDLRELGSAAAAVARELRQGSGLHQAVRLTANAARQGGQAGPGPGSRNPLAGLDERLRDGDTIAEAVDQWILAGEVDSGRAKVGVDDRELFANAMLMGFHFGGDTAAALDAVSATLVQRADLADETRALTSQARASMWTLVALPPVGVAMFSAVDAGIVETLVGTPAGRLCLGLGVALESASVLVASKMVNRTLR